MSVRAANPVPAGAASAARYEDDLYTWVREQVAHGWDDILDRLFEIDPPSRMAR